MKKTVKILGTLILIIFLILLIGKILGTSIVTKLVISPASASLVPGVSMQLNIKGYSKNGKTATDKQLQEFLLRWKYKTDSGSFTVNQDGYLSAISTGTGFVWIESLNGELKSQPIEIFVK